MMMEAFFSKFPDVARNETRSITILNDSYGLEQGQYSFIEYFCNDAECDCRRAMIQVLGPGDRSFATLGYGWESANFYTNWMFGDEEFGQNASGAHHYEMSPQTEHSDQLLILFKQMLEDAHFANRIKAHYQLFKGAFEGGRLSKKNHSPFGKSYFNKKMKEIQKD